MIAIVLLVGIVAVGSIGILLFGANATEQSQKDVEEERIKNAFIQLQQDVDSVAYSDDGVRRTKLDLPRKSDGAVRKEVAGRITVKRKNLTHTMTVVVKDIGAVIYENGEIHYAYQAGAVWRGTGNETQMVSSPDIVYDTQRDGSDPTLTLPITDLNGDDRLASGNVKVRKLYTKSPLNDVATIDNQLVKIRIESDYYVGWGRYFEDRYERAIVDYEHSKDTVIITLGRREIGGKWNHGIVSEGDVDWSAPGTPSTTIRTGGQYTGPAPYCDTDDDGTEEQSYSCVEESADINRGVLDSAIATKAKEAKSDCASDPKCEVVSSLSAGDDLEGGKTYYVQGDSLIDGGNVEVDLEDGNTTIITDGDVGMRQGGIVAEDPDQPGNCCYLRIYFNGTDLSMGNKGGLRADTLNTTRVQVYGTSEFHLDAEQIQSGLGWHAALYAPGEASTTTNHASDLDSSLGVNGCSYDVCFGQGSGTVHGAIIAGSTQFDQSADFDYTPVLRKVQPTLGKGGVIPPPITYLHVSVNKVCVGDSNCAGAATTTSTATTTAGTTTTTTSTSTTTTSTTTTVATTPSVTIQSASKITGGSKGAEVTYTVDDPNSDLDRATVKVVDKHGNVKTKTINLDGREGDTITTTVTGLSKNADQVTVTVFDDDSNTNGDSRSV